MAYSLAELPPHIRMFLQARMASGQIDQNTMNMLMSGRIDLSQWLQENDGPVFNAIPQRDPNEQRQVTSQDPRVTQTTRVSEGAPPTGYQRAQAEAEQRVRAEAQARARQAQAEAEQRARIQAEQRARAQAEQRAQVEAQARARAQAEAQAREAQRLQLSRMAQAQYPQDRDQVQLREITRDQIPAEAWARSQTQIEAEQRAQAQAQAREAQRLQLARLAQAKSAPLRVGEIQPMQEQMRRGEIQPTERPLRVGEMQPMQEMQRQSVSMAGLPDFFGNTTTGALPATTTASSIQQPWMQLARAMPTNPYGGPSGGGGLSGPFQANLGTRI